MKKPFKRVLTIALCLMMVLALVACGGNKSEDTSNDDATAEEGADEADLQAKGDGVMTYDEYAAAAVDDAVTIETFVQAKQSWWEDNGQGRASIYTQDADGGYFIYNLFCTEDEYNQLVEGQKIKVTGFKAEWAGEVEVAEGGTFELEDGNWIAEPMDITGELGSDSLIDYQNRKVSFSQMTVEPSTDADGNEAAFLYAWDGSGSEGDDLYFNVSKDGNTYSFTVESYLCDKDSDVYKAVQGLNIGDTIDMEGFLYWYEGANPHITSIK